MNYLLDPRSCQSGPYNVNNLPLFITKVMSFLAQHENASLTHKFSQVSLSKGSCKGWENKFRYLVTTLCTLISDKSLLIFSNVCIIQLIWINLKKLTISFQCIFMARESKVLHLATSAGHIDRSLKCLLNFFYARLFSEVLAHCVLSLIGDKSHTRRHVRGLLKSMQKL